MASGELLVTVTQYSTQVGWKAKGEIRRLYNVIVAQLPNLLDANKGVDITNNVDGTLGVAVWDRIFSKNKEITEHNQVRSAYPSVRMSEEITPSDWFYFPLLLLVLRAVRRGLQREKHSRTSKRISTRITHKQPQVSQTNNWFEQWRTKLEVVSLWSLRIWVKFHKFGQKLLNTCRKSVN